MTEIKLYNTKTREKEEFNPLDWQDDSIPEEDKMVRMYVCGPTVYDRAHIGNARPVIVFDVLNRLLRHVYGPDHVTYARNFTDVDDKINTRAAESGRSIREITDETIQWYLEDMGALGNLEPDVAPRATEYIAEMVAMIEELITTSHAYEAEGHVLFDVTSYEKYGSLSGRSIDDMIAGARVEVAPYKRNPMDFVLWKPSSGDLPGWESPWGYGRPGWHIECSAMTKALFGEKFDIHGGGLDLAFPHHENEKAQSCSEAGEDSFAQVWMHNEMLQVEGKKMSKSLGNFFSVRELLEDYKTEFAIDNMGPAIRLRFLQSHYRSPMDLTKQSIEAAAVKLDGWARVLEAISNYSEADLTLASNPVLEALSDDLNTAKAIHEMDNLAKFLETPYPNRSTIGPDNERVAERKAFTAGFQMLGFTVEGVNSLRHHVWSRKLKEREAGAGTKIAALIDNLLNQRKEARSQKDFARADALRDGFARAGVLVKDTPEGAIWELGPDFDERKLGVLK
ncbi:MAG: cysteine--tRNA ligase [Rhodobacteraceae bacterium]|nr:cysteine--tRNA ligase [Paracoccaceae bacterium]